MSVPWTMEGVSTLTTPGFVYFIQGVAGGLIKIGWATKPEVRLAGMQSHCPVRLRILLTIHGTGKDERELHKRFAGARRHGEWFEPVEELLGCIERFRESPPEPPTLPPKPPKISPPVESYRPPKRTIEPVDWHLTPEEEARVERLRDVVRVLE